MENTLEQFKSDVYVALLLCKEVQSAITTYTVLSKIEDNNGCNEVVDYLIYSEFFHACGAIAKLYDNNKNCLGIPKILNKFQSIKEINQNYGGDANIQATVLLISDYITSLYEDNHPLTQVKTIRDKIWAHNDKKYVDSEKVNLLDSTGDLENSIWFSLLMADMFLNSIYLYDFGEKFDIADKHYMEQLKIMVSKLENEK